MEDYSPATTCSLISSTSFLSPLSNLDELACVGFLNDTPKQPSPSRLFSHPTPGLGATRQACLKAVIIPIGHSVSMRSAWLLSGKEGAIASDDVVLAVSKCKLPMCSSYFTGRQAVLIVWVAPRSSVAALFVGDCTRFNLFIPANTKNNPGGGKD